MLMSSRCAWTALDQKVAYCSHPGRTLLRRCFVSSPLFTSKSLKSRYTLTSREPLQNPQRIFALSFSHGSDRLSDHGIGPRPWSAGFHSQPCGTEVVIRPVHLGAPPPTAHGFTSGMWKSDPVSVAAKTTIAETPQSGHDTGSKVYKPEEVSQTLRHLVKNETAASSTIDLMSIKSRRKLMRLLFLSVEKEASKPWFPDGCGGGQADRIFDTLDLNQDGQVTQREFRTWYNVHMAPAFHHVPDPLKKIVSLPMRSDDGSTSNILPSSTGVGKNDSAVVASPIELHVGTPTRALASGEDECSSRLSSSSSGSKDLPRLHMSSIPCTTAVGINVAKEEEAGILEQEGNEGEEEGDEDEELEITQRQVFLVLLRSSIPYLGFGFMDNTMMLLFGDLIDKHLGVVLGITTLAAAGIGNLLSCAFGVVAGGFIERFSYRLGIPSANLNSSQADSKKVKNLHIVGSVLGICLGCFIGMFPLLVRPNSQKDKGLSLSQHSAALGP
eukprot:GHVQ01006656.1.p1 GENE.GHVQ01006656.1~~GHVQ01006656.1.p1  ORF type:complete len:498 (-),score=73.65 GHVQ01006656.1:923-2416(-)